MIVDNKLPPEVEQLIDELLDEGHSPDEIEEVLTSDEFIEDMETILEMSDEEMEQLEEELEVIEEAATTCIWVPKINRLTGYDYEPINKKTANEMYRDLKSGKLEWGSVSPTLANAALSILMNRVDESERPEVMDYIYNDQSAFQYFITD